MREKTLLTYKSRRNRVRLVQHNTERYVIKSFSEEESFQKELEIYRMLQTRDFPCARVIIADKKTLVLTELPGINLVDCLEEQEKSGDINFEIWGKLVEWLTAFQKQTGFVMTDVNLRNFLYDKKSRALYGVDFEECAKSDIIATAASLAAFIRNYFPENTPLKREISRFVLEQFARNYDLETEILLHESEKQEIILLERRKNKRRSNRT
jgi:hypothetical protein